MKKVLIVEDEALISKYMEKLLIDFGYVVAGRAYNGKSAIELTEVSKPDLILMDIVLQGGADGIETAKSIRDKYDIPIVFISAYSDASTIRRSGETEPYGFINKPVNPYILNLVIEATLKRHELEYSLKNQIKERKKIEEKLRLSEETARVLLNSPIDAIALLDKKGTILDFNQTLQTRLKVPEDKIVGSCIFDYIPPELTAYRKTIIAEVFQTGEVRKISDERDGIWDETFVYPIFDMYGDVTTVVIYTRDITEEKKIEKEIINAIEKERRVIGQNLHDGLGQQLTGLNYLCQALKKNMTAPGHDVAHDMDEIISIISDLINKTRTLSKGLNPINIEDCGFINAVKELALDTELVFKIPCEVECEDMSITDISVQLNLYYIIRESIHNAIKHGEAESIHVGLYNDGSVFLLVIENKGKQPKSKKQKGIGLEIMKYRAGVIGAAFAATETRHGFKVEVRMHSHLIEKKTHDGFL